VRVREDEGGSTWAAVTNLSQQIQKEVLASSKQTSVLNFFRSSREHGVREEEALEEEETSDVEEVGVQDSGSGGGGGGGGDE
jgi:hypothetical protein